LIDPTNIAPSTDATCCVRVLAPASGRVLKIIQDSEGVVLPGAPLVDLGNPLDLEVVADLLSTDAVQIKVGAPVRIDGWGGPSLRGKVVRVDPAGFLKVSALGIEEQRVRVTMDFFDPPDAWSSLGHDYRVIVHVTIWSVDDALTVPISAHSERVMTGRCLRSRTDGRKQKSSRSDIAITASLKYSQGFPPEHR
jgi:HlyD family secretion protein